jgi:hypothetical protein
MMNGKRSTGVRTHRFGGDWTTAKLDVIAVSCGLYDRFEG